MKSFFTKLCNMKKNVSLFSAISLIALLLGFICLFYLVNYQKKEYSGQHFFYSREVSAKQKNKQASNNHIANALFISENKSYLQKISPYETLYYYLLWKDSLRIAIYPKAYTAITPALYNASGKKLSFKIKKETNCIILIPSSQKLKETERFFLAVTNTSVQNCSVKIQSHIKRLKHPSSPPSATPKPTKRPSSSPSAAQKPEILLSKNLLILKAGESYNLQNHLKNLNLQWLSTNQKSVSVKNGMIHAAAPGIAVIYVQSQNTGQRCCCLVRVFS
ncbi:MAG: hypothetical protein LUH14_10240 [Clostridiaceae bacterium]|nr:hypothetical protein [Clostridiaceae bacterium]